MPGQPRLERKPLRDRFLRIIGKSHLVTSALAVDEAGSRLSRFFACATPAVETTFPGLRAEESSP